MPTARNPLYRRHRFPPEVISHAVWLYFRFPLSLRLVEEMLAERGICVSYETVRQWAMKFGEASIAGEPYWLWRAVDQKRLRARCSGSASRRDSGAARRLMTKLLKAAGTPPRVMIPDELRSYAAARRRWTLALSIAKHKGLNNRAENSHQPTRRRADYEALQISSTVATVLVGSRSDRECLPRPLSRIHNCR
jgi:putative transposase